MKTRFYLFLFVFSGCIFGTVMIFQSAPGYMDADYYFVGGMQLAKGQGFSDPIIWNYLDDPKDLPHPSHGYWMPLASILAAISMKLFNSFDFVHSRILFWFIASLIPPLTMFLSYTLNQNRYKAIFSGLLATFPSFYLPYLATTDTFSLLMLLGCFWFILLIKLYQEIPINDLSFKRTIYLLLWGLLTGLFYLARVEGLLWFIVSLIIIIFQGKFSKMLGNKYIGFVTIQILLFITGYALIVVPWMVRNYVEFHSITSLNSYRSLWVTNYDELFIYPASQLNITHWLNQGLDGILKARVSAIWQNLQTAIVVQGSIILFPLLLMAIWNHRKKIYIVALCMIWIFVFSLMSLVFPLQGARGGYFHAVASLQPVLWAIVPIGLDSFIEWGQKIRRWKITEAWQFFSTGMIILMICVSGYVVYERIIGADYRNPIWNHSYKEYQKIEKYLEMLDRSKTIRIMVNNPPGYYITSERPAIVIPAGDINTLIKVAERFNVCYLILENNHPNEINDLFNNPDNQAGLNLLKIIDEAVIYNFTNQ